MSTHTLRALRTLVFVLFLAGCSSAVSPDGGSDVALTDGDAIQDTSPPGPCPATEPTSGGACTRAGLVCSYGSDPLLMCRDTATCTGGRWSVLAVDCTGQGACSATPPSGACTATSTLCAYPDGTRCNCTACPGGNCSVTSAWNCLPPPADARCPRVTPQLGAVCSPDGVDCNYGACEGGWRLVCTAGVWVDNVMPCPR